MTWQEWVTQNQIQLSQMASVYGHLKDDLLTHLCLYLETNWPTFDKIPNPQKLRWTGRWFANQARWSNSAVNRDNRVNNLPEEVEFDIADDGHIHIEILSETTEERTREWIYDTQKEFGTHKTDKLISVRFHYHNSLTLAEQILYNLYFDQMMTHRAIAKRLKIPLTSSFLMVKNLENKLIALCNGTQSLV